MIGSDLDGVLAESSKRREIEEKCSEGEIDSDLLLKAWKGAELVNERIADILDIIITARPRDCRRMTEEWLEEKGVDYEHLFMFPGTTQDIPSGLEEISKWKKKVIDFAQVFLFFEDHPAHVKCLKENTDAYIVKVNP